MCWGCWQYCCSELIRVYYLSICVFYWMSSVLETIDTLFLWERSAGTTGQTRAGDIEHSWSHFSSSAPILLNIGNPRARDQPQLSQNHHSLWMLPWERCGAGTAMLSKDTAVTHKLHSQHKNENVWFFQSDYLTLCLWYLFIIINIDTVGVPRSTLVSK